MSPDLARALATPCVSLFSTPIAARAGGIAPSTLRSWRDAHPILAGSTAGGGWPRYSFAQILHLNLVRELAAMGLPVARAVTYGSAVCVRGSGAGEAAGRDPGEVYAGAPSVLTVLAWLGGAEAASVIRFDLQNDRGFGNAMLFQHLGRPAGTPRGGGFLVVNPIERDAQAAIVAALNPDTETFNDE